MEKARDKFKIGQLVQIIVQNSHYHEFGRIVAFDAHNEYNVKVAFDEGYVNGYMVDELKPLPRLGQTKLSLHGKMLKKLANSFKSCKNWKELKRNIIHKNFEIYEVQKETSRG